MSRETSYAIGPTLLTILAGAAVGAVIMAFTTPKTGPELRGDINKLTRRLRRSVGGGPSDGAKETWDGRIERRILIPADRRRDVMGA